jgi:hypothetical protein
MTLSAAHTPPITAALTAAGEDSPSHADYDLHPLVVRSLEHYVEHDDNERFHVR